MTDDERQFYDATKADALLKSLARQHPDWVLVNLVAYAITTNDGIPIVGVSNSLYTDLLKTAESSGGSTGFVALLNHIVNNAVDERSQQIGRALEATVDLVVGGETKSVLVLIERVAPDAAIMRYHPSQ